MLWRNGRPGDVMATDWTAVTLGALGVAGTIGGGFIGAWMQDRTQRHLERERDRDRQAQFVAEAFQLHIDLAPSRFDGLSPQELQDRINELTPRHDAILTQLWIIGVQNPDLRMLSQQVAAALTESLEKSAGFVHARHRGMPAENEKLRKQAQVQSALTEQELAKLLAAMQSMKSGRGTLGELTLRS